MPPSSPCSGMTYSGGTRHFGYDEDPKSYNPFPLSGSLRRTEEQLFHTLHGLRVTGIDVVERHVRKARKTTRKVAAEKKKKKKKGDDAGSLEVHHMEYHHLGTFEDASFDAGYTMRRRRKSSRPSSASLSLFMTRFFYALTIVPFWIVSLLRLEHYFINTVAGIGAHRSYGFWRIVWLAYSPSALAQYSRTSFLIPKMAQRMSN
ncbi:hypothetical protein F5Y12DRAFT_711950 [Xylaria sp. FL1777]|nr:hypothetical protein F5Y12DRAFT_711950 [Xylaria sp. FL1777]